MTDAARDGRALWFAVFMLLARHKSTAGAAGLPISGFPFVFKHRNPAGSM